MKESAVINPSTAKQVRTAVLKLADANNPMLALSYKDIGADPESPNEYCAVEIDANGSTGSKFILFLNIGPSSSDYTQYQFSAYATGVTDPSAVDSSPTHTQCTTLKALILAMRASDAGLTVYRGDAPADYSIDTDDFIDLAEVEFGGPPLKKIMYKDASEILTQAVRIGVPEMMDHGKIEILGVRCYADSNSATDCELKISTDPSDTDESKEIEIAYFTKKVPDATETDMYPESLHDNPPVVQGPILVEMTATTSLAVNAIARILYRSAEW